MTGLPFHPLANLFPLIEGERFDDLVADVAANGLIDPIVLLDGQILDGRNRYRAAVQAGLIDVDAALAMGTRFVDFAHQYPNQEPLNWVISKNLNRRHLNESQRAMVAAKLADIQNGRAPIGAVSNQHAADALHVGKRSVQRARRVVREGVPELAEAVEAGDLKVSVAADLARLPKEDQKQVLADADPDALYGLLREREKAAKAKRNADKKAKRAEKEKALAAKQAALPDKRYGVVYADPEWKFEPFSAETGMDRAADNHYPCSALEAIKARPVADIAAKDCVLFLWATVPMLPQALEVMAAWGFDYKSHYVWVKDHAGHGYWNRNKHELLLIGTRGAVPAPAMGEQWDSAIPAPLGPHSAKPDCFAQMIEAYYPNLAKIELNARAPRDGWDVWGNESDGVGGEEDGGDAGVESEAIDGGKTKPSEGVDLDSRLSGNDKEPKTYSDLVADLAPQKGKLSKKLAEDALRAGRAEGVGLGVIAADLGHPIGTVRTWVHRLGIREVSA